jgi:hypothetical protein
MLTGSVCLAGHGTDRFENRAAILDAQSGPANELHAGLRLTMRKTVGESQW